MNVVAKLLLFHCDCVSGYRVAVGFTSVFVFVSTLANVCFLLTFMMMEDASFFSKLLTTDATKQLLKRLGPDNDAPVRAKADGAIKSLFAQCQDAIKEIANCNGIPTLINATIAPFKEFMQREHDQAIHENAMSALANISGGLPYVIFSLSKSLESCSSPTQTADTLGALASALMIYDDKEEYTKASYPLAFEKTLLEKFKPCSPFGSLSQLIFPLDLCILITDSSKYLNDVEVKELNELKTLIFEVSTTKTGQDKRTKSKNKKNPIS
ncbi:hypothetical protein RYX36_020853 [Vicia faba]